MLKLNFCDFSFGGLNVERGAYMMMMEKKVCPSCAGVLPAIANLCIHCGKDLRYDQYQIVPDGLSFGVSLKGRIVIHSLELKEAQEVVSIMNSEKPD
jgi:hypothetical protein